MSSLIAAEGADGAVHMCEEIKGASTVVPQTLMISVAINGVLGFAMLVAVLFCTGNIDNAIKTPTGYPFIEIFAQATKSTGGATGLSMVIVLLIFCANINVFTATSRMMWAFARDRGLPGSGVLGRVSIFF